MLRNDLNDRKKMILAIKFVCEHIANETIYNTWRNHLIPDDNIGYKDFDINSIDDNDKILTDENFKELMSHSTQMIAAANRTDGLVCGNICSQTKDSTQK